MALRCRLRSAVVQRRCLFSTSETLAGSRDRSRAVLSLIQFEQDPDRILQTCRSTNLDLESHLGRLVYSKAISKLRNANQQDGIRSFIYDSMEKLHTKSERVASHFIILYGQAGLISDAVKLFDEMPDRGINRNVKMLNSLLFSCNLAGEYDEMRRIFLGLPRKYGLEPNLDTYNTVLMGLCRSGCVGEAHAVLAEMERKSVKPNTTTLATVIAGFYAEESFIDVGKMMALMKKHGIEPGISIYNVRIQSLCKLKRSFEAKALLGGILAKGLKPNCATYGHLVHGFCREGKLDVARGLLKETVDRGLEPQAECYFTLVYYLCQGRDFEGALEVCKECMSKGWVPNFTTMRCLVSGLVRIGRVKDARAVIGRVKEKFSRNADKWKEIEEELLA